MEGILNCRIDNIVISGRLLPELNLVVSGFNTSTNELSLTVEGTIPPGDTFHLRSSFGLNAFAPLAPGLDFDSATPMPLIVPIDPVSNPTEQFQIYSGPSLP